LIVYISFQFKNGYIINKMTYIYYFICICIYIVYYILYLHKMIFNYINSLMFLILKHSFIK